MRTLALLHLRKQRLLDLGSGKMRFINTLKTVASVIVIMTSIPAYAISHGNQWANASSPLGVNVNTATGSYPFLNAFKMGGNWQTATTSNCKTDTNEESLLYSNFLDSNGYPTTLTGGPTHTFTNVCVSIYFSSPSPYFYPAGNYRLTWTCSAGACATDGTNTIVIGGDPSATCTTSPCTFNVATPTASGITVAITATHDGNYINNIALVLSSNAAALDAGEKFDPSYVSKHRNFSTLRFMDAINIINNANVNWSDRAQLNYAFWNIGEGCCPSFAPSPTGWPYEVIIALCNELNADCWINEPVLTNATYISNMATLFAANLNQNIHVYVEYGNELWNGVFSSAVTMQLVSLGAAAFPNAVNNFQKEVYYGLQRTVADQAIWKSVFGQNASRVIRVLGGWAGNDVGYNQSILPQTSPVLGGGTWSGTIASHVDVLATAPYYGFTAPSAWTASSSLCGSATQTDQGVTCLFKQLTDGSIIPTGAGASATGGTSTAYTLADGAGTGCPAPVNSNGYLTVATFNQTNGANPTLAVDGCTPAPLQLDSNATAPAASSLTASVGQPYLLAFTNATALGAVTASWRIVCGPGVSCSGQTIPDVLGFIGNNLTTATNNSVGLVLYEGGWGFVAPSTGDIWSNLYIAASRDSRAYTSTLQLMNGLRTRGLNGVFNYFEGIGASGFRGEAWGLWESTYQAPVPSKAQGALDFIQSNPCWWTNCRH